MTEYQRRVIMQKQTDGSYKEVSVDFPLEVHDPKVGSLISYEGTTTADGAGDGSSLIDSVLTTKPDYDGHWVVITSGPYFGQCSDITAATTGGTVTAHEAFDGQIVSGTKFVILAMKALPAEVAALLTIVTAIQAVTDLLPDAGALTTLITHLTDLKGAGWTDENLTTIDSLIDTLLTRVTAAVALASVCTEARLAELGSTNIPADTDPKVMGRKQVVTTTWDLLRAGAGAGTDVLFTGTTQAVILESLIVRMPATPDATNDPFTSIAIATDDAEPGVIIDATAGARANLTAEAQLAWTGALYIAPDTEIEGTIAGDDADEETLVTIIATYRAVVSGGYLAP